MNRWRLAPWVVVFWLFALALCVATWIILAAAVESMK